MTAARPDGATASRPDGVTLSRAGGPSLRSDPRCDVRLRAVEAWRLLREQDDRTLPSPVSREHRLDSERHLTALRREADAVHAHLCRPRPVGGSRPTVVIVHRKAWLREKVELALTARGIEMVGCADDGADGSGTTIALTPTLLLLEAQLPSMSGPEVARRVARCCPGTLVTALARDLDDRSALVAAGVAWLWGREVLPVVIATDIAALLQAQR